MRRFEYKDEKSNKFWEVSFDATSITIQWGNVGSKGQASTKTVSDPEAEAKKKIESKLKQGYVEVSGAADEVEAEKLEPPDSSTNRVNPADAQPSALDRILSLFEPKGVVDRFMEATSAQLPSASPFTFYNSLEGATQRLAEGNPAVLRVAHQIAEGPMASRRLYVVRGRYLAPVGYLGFVEHKLRITPDEDGTLDSIHWAHQMDAFAKFFGMLQLTQALVPGEMDQQNESIGKLPAWKEIISGLTICKLAVPFGDHLSLGGAEIARRLMQGKRIASDTPLEQFEHNLATFFDRAMMDDARQKQMLQLLSSLQAHIGQVIDEYRESPPTLKAMVSELMPKSEVPQTWSLFVFLGGRLMAEACVLQAMGAE